MRYWALLRTCRGLNTTNPQCSGGMSCLVRAVWCWPCRAATPPALVLYLPTAAIISCTSLQLHAAVDSGGAISAMSRFFSRQFPLRPAGNRPNPSCITCKDGPSQKSGPSKASQLRSHLLIWSDGSKAQMSSLPMQKRTIAGAHRMEGNVSLGKNHKKKCWDFKMYMKT